MVSKCSANVAEYDLLSVLVVSTLSTYTHSSKWYKEQKRRETKNTNPIDKMI